MSFEDLNDTSERHEMRIVRCQACGARIVFLSTAARKKIPVDADTVEADDEAYEHGRHVAHFATCSDPERFRKPR